MATLRGKKVVIIGGSSGIGYAVAKASLLSLADHVLVASSSLSNVDTAVQRLLAEPSLQGQPGLPNRVGGEVLNIRDTQAVRQFFDKIGEIDHLVITAGSLSSGQEEFRDANIEEYKDALDERFWGPVAAAQKAQIRPAGSIIFTIGTAVLKPIPKRSVLIGIGGAVDALTRGLAIDLAPIRVNSVCPGAVDTELWKVPPEVKAKHFEQYVSKQPVKHIAHPDEIAEAYLFLMKSDFVTGQRIVVDGGITIV